MSRTAYRRFRPAPDPAPAHLYTPDMRHFIVRSISDVLRARGQRPIVLQWLAARRKYGDYQACLYMGVLYGYEVGAIFRTLTELSVHRKLTRGWRQCFIAPEPKR